MPKKKTATVTRLPTRGSKPGRGKERPLPGALPEGEEKTDDAGQGEEIAREIAERLESLGEKIGIIFSDDPDEEWDWALRDLDTSNRALVRAGTRFLRLKDQMPHGEFLPALEARHVPRRRAQEAMQIARWILRWSAPEKPNARLTAHLKKLIDLGPEKLRLLSRVDPETIETQGLQAEIDLDDVAVMSVADLRKNLRKTRKKTQELGIQAEHWRTTAHQLQHLTGAPPAGSEHPASVTRARSESAALGDQAQLTISALEHQWAVLIAAPDLGNGSAERTRNLQVGGRSILLHLGAVADAACRALNDARDALGPFLPEADEWGLDDQPPPLTLEVAAQLAQWRAVHIRQMEINADDREAERVRRGEIKRGQGRPRKTRVLPQAKRKAGRPRKR